jgi:hypothetical protein
MELGGLCHCLHQALGQFLNLNLSLCGGLVHGLRQALGLVMRYLEEWNLLKWKL